MGRQDPGPHRHVGGARQGDPIRNGAFAPERQVRGPLMHEAPGTYPRRTEQEEDTQEARGEARRKELQEEVQSQWS
eukprot:10859731-Heterocapsa_arctica.AAC.1